MPPGEPAGHQYPLKGRNRSRQATRAGGVEFRVRRHPDPCPGRTGPPRTRMPMAPATSGRGPGTAETVQWMPCRTMQPCPRRDAGAVDGGHAPNVQDRGRPVHPSRPEANGRKPPKVRRTAGTVERAEPRRRCLPSGSGGPGKVRKGHRGRPGKDLRVRAEAPRRLANAPRQAGHPTGIRVRSDARQIAVRIRSETPGPRAGFARPGDGIGGVSVIELIP